MAFSFFFWTILIIWSFGLLPDRNDLMDQTLSSLFFLKELSLKFYKDKKEKEGNNEMEKGKKKKKQGGVKSNGFNSVQLTLHDLNLSRAVVAFFVSIFLSFFYVFRPLLNYFLII